jgi:hypothetical protein
VEILEIINTTAKMKSADEGVISKFTRPGNPESLRSMSY